MPKSLVDQLYGWKKAAGVVNSKLNPPKKKKQINKQPTRRRVPRDLASEEAERKAYRERRKRAKEAMNAGKLSRTAYKWFYD